MGFKEFLSGEAVKQHLGLNRKWWSDYIYHFSHVTNVANILNDNMLKSRTRIMTEMPLNYNENASLDVINGTTNNAHDYVRFYFRPLTPTQYNSEGVRSNEEINNLKAHCPVPAFMLFDTEILENEETMFTYESLASHHEVQLYSSVDHLMSAPLESIYHSGPILGDEQTKRQVKKNRHAEVVIPDSCDLSQLKRIICRTQAEKETLLSLLNEEAKHKHQDKIQVLNNIHHYKELFYSDKLMITKVTQLNNATTVNFNSNHDKDVLRNISIYWTDAQNNNLFTWINLSVKTRDLIGDGNLIAFTTQNLGNAYNKVKIYIDGNLIFQNEFNKIST